MKRNHSVILVKVVLFFTIAIAGFGQAVLHLWNWLMPGIFGLTVITFWQAVGLLALSWLLFGGWRGFHGVQSASGRRWRGRLRERWERMTPDERARFQEGIRSHHGPAGASSV